MNSRPIKLRFWSNKQNKFVHQPRIWISDQGLLNYEYGEGEDLIISEWTGLKDKNGVEIYEGDIIEIIFQTNYEDFITEKYIGNVEFGKCCVSETSESPQDSTIGFYINTKERQIGLFPDHNLCDGFATLEIIGNIFQNSLDKSNNLT